MVGSHLPFWRIDAETVGRGGVHPSAYVSVEGAVIDIVEDDLELHQIPLASRYLGEQGGRAYLDSLPPTEWKRYIISPSHWLSYDGSKSAS